MALLVAELIFNDTNSRPNKDLTSFLRRNIDSIMTKGMIEFRFRIAGKNDLSKLRNAGIDRLPAMRIDNCKKIYMSVDSIISELRNRVSNSRRTAPLKTSDEIIDDYYKKELGYDKLDSEGKIDIGNLDQNDMPEDIGEELRQKTLHELDRRNLKEKSSDKQPDRQFAPKFEETGTSNTNRQPTNTKRRNDREDNVSAGDPMETLNKMRKNGGNNADDDLMETLLSRLGPDLF